MKRRVLKLKQGVKRMLIIVSCLLVLLIFCGCFTIFNSSFNYSDEVVRDNKKENALNIKVSKEYSAKLLMVGDALIHSAIYEDAKLYDGSYNFNSIFEYIKPIAMKYDLAYYNQETILGGTELGLSNYPRFNSPYEVGDAFIDSGFNLVSLATNHTMDKGEQGVINSVNYWNSKNVVSAGQYLSINDRNNIKINETNGIKYAFLSYTTCTNGLETPIGKEYLNNVYSDIKATNDIKSIRDKVDFVIVAMHWGNEYSFGISEEQINISNHLSNLGTDLIIGSHPHVVEPVEFINNGKTLVIYSLGNFVSDQIGNERLTGLMMEITLNKYVDKDGNISNTLINPKAELIYTKSDNSRKRNFKVYPYSKLNDFLLPGYLDLEKKYKSIVSVNCPDLAWGITGE